MPGPLSAIPAGSLKPVTGTDDADEKYRSALEKITSALEAREANNTQQLLLGIAQGMLTPGPTGSFGESVGQAAGNVNKLMQAQEGAGLENAKMRLQLAQAEREMAQRNKAASAFQGIVSGQQPGQQPGVPAGAPGAPAGASAAPSAPGGEKTVRTVSMDDALRFAAAYPEQKELANMLVNAAKYGSDRFKIALNGTVFDTQTERYIDLPIPGQKADEYYVPEIGGKLLMTPNEYSSYRKAKEQGNGTQWLQIHMGNKEQLPKTSAQIEAQAAADREKATKTAAAETDRTQQTIDAGRGAGTRISHFKTMEGFAKQPGVAALLGYFERPDFLSAAGKFMEEGKFGVPQLREVLTNLGAPQDVINNLNVLASMAAQTSIDFSKTYGKGQGAVSDFERRLYASLGPTIKDPLEAFMMKSKLLTAKAEYDRDLAQALRRSKMDVDSFMDTPQYQKVVDAYQNKVYEVAGIKKPAAIPTGPITGADAKSRRDAAKERVGDK